MKALQSNLVCLLHHGSRGRGEARPDSDYDSVIIAEQMNEEVIRTLKGIFSKYLNFSFYLLSIDDLKALPKAHYLEFLNAKPLYGSIEMHLPTKEEVISYINHKKGDVLSTVRHTLILPHLNERKAKLVYFSQRISEEENSFYR